ncbi:MAG TPA: PEP-CTERM/exosortase system-associated acyltransferase [Nitrosomonas sp.]|nr:PEP-CTERM/exosortase system-associated acyltransferase [Nitrosomonas sp.]
MNDLYNSFQRFFEIVMADTAELLDKVYKIRYQVLCVEKRLPGFDADQCPGMLEKDSYDHHSSHVLVKYRPTGDYIGTVRIILADSSQPDKLFPIELYGQSDPELCDIKTLPRIQTAEISRAVVIGQFDRRRGEDRRKGERRKALSNSNTNKIVSHERRGTDRRSALNIALVLMAGVVRMSKQYGIRNWLSIMDPALNRLLSYDGLEFDPIGPPVNYHGMRRPYFVKVEEVLTRMYTKHHDAWEVVTDCGKYDLLLSSDEKVLN